MSKVILVLLSVLVGSSWAFPQEPHDDGFVKTRHDDDWLKSKGSPQGPPHDDGFIKTKQHDDWLKMPGTPPADDAFLKKKQDDDRLKSKAAVPPTTPPIFDYDPAKKRQDDGSHAKTATQDDKTRQGANTQASLDIHGPWQRDDRHSEKIFVKTHPGRRRQGGNLKARTFYSDEYSDEYDFFDYFGDYFGDYRRMPAKRPAKRQGGDVEDDFLPYRRDQPQEDDVRGIYLPYRGAQPHGGDVHNRQNDDYEWPEFWGKNEKWVPSSEEGSEGDLKVPRPLFVNNLFSGAKVIDQALTGFD